MTSPVFRALPASATARVQHATEAGVAVHPDAGEPDRGADAHVCHAGKVVERWQAGLPPGTDR
jgi:hypothetical protein